MICRGYHLIVVYFDDFLIIGNSKDKWKAAYECLAALFLYLIFQLSETKLVSPPQCITFLGVEINSLTMTFSLPADKLGAFWEVMLNF